MTPRARRIPIGAAAILLALAALAPPGRATLPTDFADQLVVGGLSQPSSFAFLPDGRLIIVEQKTRNVLVAAVGSSSATAILNIADVNTSGTERGLLGVAVDSAWPLRPYLYFHFNQTPSGKVWIARYTASGDLSNPASVSLTLADRHDLIDDVPDAAFNHNGGTLRFGPDHMLYASFGEDADGCGAQDSTTFKGVILRLDVSGVPPGPGGPPGKLSLTPIDNPFTGGNSNAGLVWAFGLRNPFRFHADGPTGHLYIADVGNNTWEEVDECAGGENFGWPYYEGPATVGGTCPPQSAYTPPIAWYNRTGVTASVISVGRYRCVPGGASTFPADYEGDYLYSDYYMGWIRRIRFDGSTWSPAPAAPGQPNVTDWATAIANVSDWLTGPDGALYYCKQFSAASIRRIVYTGTQSGVGDDPMPRPFHLTLFPNPFPAGTADLTITLSGGLSGAIQVAVFDATGRRVRRLADHATPDAPLAWDGRDDSGAPAPSGVYFIQISGTVERSARVVLARE